MKAATYLHFKHNAKEAIEAYKAIFDAEVVCQYLYEEGMSQNPELLGKVFHAELRLGDLNLYLADSGTDPSFPSTEFVVEFSEEGQAHQCFEDLVQKGNALSAFEAMPFGPTIARTRDQFGIVWNIVIC